MKSEQQAYDRYVAIHSSGKNPPLFWILPYFVQSLVIKGLGRDQPVYGLRAMKKNPKQMTLTLEQLAAYYIETIRSLQPQGPYALAGYCIAAVVAQEIARQLYAQGEKVGPLILIEPPDPIASEAYLIRDPVAFRIRVALNRLLFHLQRTREIGAGDRMAYVLDSLEQVQKRVIDRIKQVVYKFFAKSRKPLPQQLQGSYDFSVQAFLNSAPKPYPGSALLIRPAISSKNVYDYANRRWAQLITGGLDIHECPGDSNSMWQSPNAEEMSLRISLFLENKSELHSDASQFAWPDHH